jgi:hypothetical protein
MTTIDNVQLEGEEKGLDSAKGAVPGNRRFQVNFASACDARAIDEFVGVIQEAYGVRNKYDAASLMLSLAKKQFAREDAGAGRVGFAEKHFSLLEAQAGNLMTAFKNALENADFGNQAIQQQCAEKIEQIENETARKIAANMVEIQSLRENKGLLESATDRLSEEVAFLKKENEAMMSLKLAFEKSESAWQIEKAGLQEKIAAFEKTNEINAELKAENSALIEEAARLKSALQETSHAYEIKIKDSLIESERRLADRISAEVKATEQKDEARLQPIIDGLNCQVRDLQEQLKTSQEVSKTLAADRIPMKGATKPRKEKMATLKAKAEQQDGTKP